MYREGGMAVTKKTLEYKHGEKIFEGFVYYPSNLESSSSKRGGVLVLHAFGGCTDFEREQAEKLAKQGFVALAADLYGKDVKCESYPEWAKVCQALAADREELGARLTASRNALASLSFVDENKIGAMGYCFGGLGALDMARRNVPGLKAAVSFHGTLKPIEGAALGPMAAAVQCHNGQADSNIDKEQIAAFYVEMNERKADWQFVQHGGAQHGFTEPHAASLGFPGVAYQKEAAERSWRMMIDFMKERLA